MGRSLGRGRFVERPIGLIVCQTRDVLGPVDPDVFAGRDPAWRMTWEALKAEDRKQVSDAVRGGRRVDGRNLEPFVYGLIARRRRQQRWRIVQTSITIAITGFWVVATTVIRPSPFRWFSIPTLILVLGVAPIAIRSENRRLDRAEQAQTQ